jgi:nucleoside-triphosphatase THEP1
MIYIITGEINSGKSSYLLKLYNRNRIGDGFYNRKLFSDSNYIGQEIVKLSNGHSSPFSYKSGYLPMYWDELFTYQDYSFSRSGLLFCSEIIRSSLNNPLPCYIDEIGPLELQEIGLYQEFIEILQTKKDIYVVIRNRCLSDVLLKFKIDEYIMFEPKPF